ncbi:MAG: hypothetical protein HYZ28_25925 [Myxococcales bacterium]|nr:hypothetical protein [Myxococcales bacterium]
MITGWARILLAATAASACGVPPGSDFADALAELPDGAAEPAVDGDAGLQNDAGAVDAGPQDGGTADAGLACPAGMVCVDSFPFRSSADTKASNSRRFDRYGCAPTIDESGPELVYRVPVPSSGFLSAAVSEQAGVDVDVHLLSALDAAACLHRGNFDARADVAAGIHYVVVDTYSGGGVERSGAFRLDIGFVEPSVGPCEMQSGWMSRVGDNGNSLQMPATGPIVREAHLVTQEEPPPYPSTSTEELEAHYELSQSRGSFVMHRREVWAPLEGGTFYGAGIGSPSLFPVLHEAWYVNMYWTSTSRPARGTRMILRAADGGTRAVVVAAGYETGPGDLNAVGGTTEESHFYMGTTHRSQMTLGIAADQALPFGPRTCSF